MDNYSVSEIVKIICTLSGLKKKILGGPPKRGWAMPACTSVSAGRRSKPATRFEWSGHAPR